MNERKTMRDKRIDILRGVAILFIMLAHISPPNNLLQLRTFDVPLITMLLGMSFSLSTKEEKYRVYLFKRFKRLIIPTWKVLLGYFILFGAIALLRHKDFPYHFEYIISSFAMSSDKGIGYMWILRIFFEIALLSPIFKWLYSLKEKRTVIILLFIFCMLLLEYAQNLSLVSTGHFLILFALELVGYSFIVFIGICVYNNRMIDNLKFCGLFVFLFFVSILKTKSFDIQAFKYPPQLQYISYGLSLSILLFLVTTLLSKKIVQYKLDPIIWLSKNSIQIYYIHIFIVRAVDRLPVVNNWWETRYLVTVGISSIAVYLFGKIKTMTVRKSTFKLSNSQ